MAIRNIACALAPALMLMAACSSTRAEPEPIPVEQGFSDATQVLPAEFHATTIGADTLRGEIEAQ
jgi:hypothetical protein